MSSATADSNTTGNVNGLKAKIGTGTFSTVNYLDCFWNSLLQQGFKVLNNLNITIQIKITR